MKRLKLFAMALLLLTILTAMTAVFAGRVAHQTKDNSVKHTNTINQLIDKTK
jgi:hypothetical protein